MEIRAADTADLPAIIELMRQSLGEKLMPKSEDFYLWKHAQNVFGPSHVILAVDSGQLVGLRAFMKWKWSRAGEEIIAVRAVDTATHPDFQGKGIFRKLTMQAVEDCKKQGVSLVFNTPNPISKQGYLTMGWQEAGKLPLIIGTGSIWPRRYSSWNSEKLIDNFDFSSSLASFSKDWKWPANSSKYQTGLTYRYLSWRYRDCPRARYGMLAEPDKFGFIFRIKPFKGFMELRICEVWAGNDSKSQKEARLAYNNMIFQLRPALVSSVVSDQISLPRSFGPFRKGPVVTVRPLFMEGLGDFINFSNWQPSVGAMEIF